VSSREKIIPSAALSTWRQAQRQAGKKLVVTNGCFDLLHAGHVTYLEQARALGDELLIGLNSDAAVQHLKGSHRPVNCEADRAIVLAALGCVDAVSVFNEQTAASFLTATQPDVYVKGGDYSLETINQEERRIVEQAGGKIVIVSLVPNRSTTGILAKIACLG